MNSMRKIFTGLDFGGRRIKGAKIEDQPYYVPFSFSDSNANTPVPQEIIDELNHRIDYATEKEKNLSHIFIIVDDIVTIPQIALMVRNEHGILIEGIFYYYGVSQDEHGNIRISIRKVLTDIIVSEDGTWTKHEVASVENNEGTSFYTLDLNNYTTNIFNELSAMTLGTTIQVIDKSGRPCLYQIADHEPDYVTINSYMRYDDDDEDPEILSYTLRANGTINGPTVRIRLETTGGGEKFLSDLGWYKEIKIPELTNAKVTQEEYNALEAAGTLDANTIYYIIG